MILDILHVILIIKYKKKTDEPILKQYFKDLTMLIENIYKNNNFKSILISHSLGSTITNLFLNSKTSEWRTKYIKGWYSINGLFGPTTESLGSIIFGSYPILHQIFSNDVILSILRNNHVFYNIMPTPYNTNPNKVKFFKIKIY